MEQAEFERVVDAHYTDLYRFALSLARNIDDACDLTQQTFAIFARKSGEIRDLDKLRSWLFTTLYREFLRNGTRAKKVVSMETSELEQCAAPAEGQGSRSAEQREMLEALAGLEEAQRAVLTLFYLDGLSYKDIAGILDVPLGTVMSRLVRAKDALRDRLEKKPAKGINPGA